jgi:hypothetical protein
MKYRTFMNNVDNFLKNNSQTIGFPLLNFSLTLMLISFTVILIAMPELSLTFNLFGSNSLDTIDKSIVIENSNIITALVLLFTANRALLSLADFFTLVFFCKKHINKYNKKLELKEYRKNIQKYPY